MITGMADNGVHSGHRERMKKKILRNYELQGLCGA